MAYTRKLGQDINNSQSNSDYYQHSKSDKRQNRNDYKSINRNPPSGVTTKLGGVKGTITSSDVYKEFEQSRASKYQTMINDEVDTITSIDNRSEQSLLYVLNTIGGLNRNFNGVIINHRLSMINHVRSVRLLGNVVIITQDSGTLNCIIKDNIEEFGQNELQPAIIKLYSGLVEDSLADIVINEKFVKAIGSSQLILDKLICIKYEEDDELDIGKLLKDVGIRDIESNLAEGYINLRNFSCDVTPEFIGEITINYGQFDSYETAVQFIKSIITYKNYLIQTDIKDLILELEEKDDYIILNLTEDSPEAKLKYFVQTQVSMDSSMSALSKWLERNDKSPALSFENENVNVEVLGINDKQCQYNVWIDGSQKKHKRVISKDILDDSYELIKYNIKFKYMYILADVLPKVLPIDVEMVRSIMGINVPINKRILIDVKNNPKLMILNHKFKKMRIPVNGKWSRYLEINKSGVTWTNEKTKDDIVISSLHFLNNDVLIMFIHYLQTKGNHLYLSNDYINKEQQLINRKLENKKRA